MSKYRPSPGVAGAPPWRKVRGRVGLQRRLVRAEARVPVDPEQRHLRGRHEVGRECRQVPCQPFQRLDHRRAHVGFVVGLASAKPLALVVPLKRPEECQRLARKGRRHGVVPWQSSSCLSPDSVIARSSGAGGNRVLCGFPTTLWARFSTPGSIRASRTPRLPAGEPRRRHGRVARIGSWA